MKEEIILDEKETLELSNILARIGARRCRHHKYIPMLVDFFERVKKVKVCNGCSLLEL